MFSMRYAMKKLLNLAGLIGLLLLTACTKAPPPEIVHTDVVRPQNTATFNRIIVTGNIDLNINTGTPQQSVTLAGDSEDLNHVRIKVFNDSLYIEIDKKYPQVKPISALINTQFLNAITFNGNGSVNTTNLQSPVFDLVLNGRHVVVISGRIGLRKLYVNGDSIVNVNGVDSRDLDLALRGKAKINLTGMANIRNLKVSGNTHFGFYWVNSDELTLTITGKSSVQLAGVVDKLYLRLEDAAHFDGKYLRARRLYAKTYGTSFAEVRALSSQAVLASDYSNVYFYNDPNFKAGFMANSGAVIDATRPPW